MSVRLLVWALALQLLLAGLLIYFAVTGFPFLPSHGAGPDRFDAQRARADVRAQEAYGARPAGSAAADRLARWLRTQLPGGRLVPAPGGGSEVVGELAGAAPALTVAARYATASAAADPAHAVAVVVEAARTVATDERPRGTRAVRFVLVPGAAGSPAGAPGEVAIAGARAAVVRRQVTAAGLDAAGTAVVDQVRRATAPAG